jgi:hypothetical protein
MKNEKLIMRGRWEVGRSGEGWKLEVLTDDG